MPNTGHDKRLASFNVDIETWEEFKVKARLNGVNATFLLNQWIKEYLKNTRISRQFLDDQLIVDKLLPVIAQQVKDEVELAIAAHLQNQSQ